MKIAWGTPTHQQSAIGRVSADVVGALVARGHQVKVIATEWEREDHPRHAFGVEVQDWRRLGAGWASDHDLLIANIGDHFLNHGGLFALFGALPTVGIFHDFYLYNLFNGWVWDGGRPENEQNRRRNEVLRATYGEAGAALRPEGNSGRQDFDSLAAQPPMTEWIAARCHGALTHADFYLERVAAACPGPAASAAMPVTARGVEPLPDRHGRKLRALTVGVMNPNKCVDRVIEAIAGSTLREALAYSLVGPISPEEGERLTGLAERLGFEGLEIHGAATDAELSDQLSQADIICCLRRPVLEGSSGSAIEGLLAGRPLLVADAGFYAELPDDLVFKVDAEVPVVDVRAQLERLADDEPLRQRSGAAGAAWATQRFDLGAYAARVETLAQETLSAMPILRVGADFGERLAALGLTPLDPAVARIGAEVSALLAPS